MGLSKELARLGMHQVGNMVKIILGRPVTTPVLGSATLDKDDVEVARSMLSQPDGWYESDTVHQYETAFAQWNGSRYAFAFMGGRVALSAAIHALGLLPGDEVILPGYTCVVVPNAFHFAGVETIYSDIELDTYGLDASRIEDRISSKTKAILLHHLYGLVCRDYETILNIAHKYRLKVIEDCAQATGAEYKGNKVGNLGDIAIYSSEQSKVFNTIQGGVATTNDNNIAECLREYSVQAPYPDRDRIRKLLYNVILNYYRFKHRQRWWLGDVANVIYGRYRLISTTKEEVGGQKPARYGHKMPAPIAALGLNQIGKLERYNQLRRIAAQKWDAWCAASGYKQPLVLDNSVPVFLRYPVMVEPERKADTSWALRELGVQLGVWFLGNAHPVNLNIENCPNADKAVVQCINFPTVMG